MVKGKVQIATTFFLFSKNECRDYSAGTASWWL